MRTWGNIALLSFAILFVGAVGCGRLDPTVHQPQPKQNQVDESTIDHLANARRAISNRDWASADEELRRQLLRNPGDFLALEMAGDTAAAQGNMRESALHYQAAVDNHPKASIELLDKLAQQWSVAGCVFESLAVLQDAIKRYPSHLQFRFDLEGLGTMIGMEQESLEQSKWLAQHNQGSFEGFIALAGASRIEPDESICEKSLQLCPDDLRIHYPLARLDAGALQWSSVAERLEAVVERHQDFIPAQLLYGRAIIELNRLEEIQEWHAALPVGVHEFPSYWLAAGRWAEQQGQFEQATRAYWEAVQRDASSDPRTLEKLAINLARIGRGDMSPQLVDRVKRFALLNDALDKFDWRDCESQSTAMEIAHHMKNLGRLWEAEGWARMALTLKDDQTADARQSYVAIRSKLKADTPWQLAAGIVGDQLDLGDLPQVAWMSNHSPNKQKDLSQVSGVIRMQDEAFGRGLLHTCELAPEAKETGYAIFQTSGGGAAVIDFDLDGWPDLSFAMLDGNPMKFDSKPNQLFRNLAGQFRNITVLAGLNDRGFAQGITTGDFNDDGFPDLFDANIGRNRLYCNNGDGTFTDVTDETGLHGEYWTTSAVIADINRDGFADLFEVQYCSGETPYTKECPSSTDKGRIGSCSPLLFKAEPDRVWQGTATGQFVEATDQWLGHEAPGRGLGLSVGYFDEQPGIDIYVANDMSANQFWSSGQADKKFHLSDMAVLRGLAVSGASKSQASMGIAAGDPDEDGDIDFFLTHFARDHNTFYQQGPPGNWSDLSHRVGLGESSMNTMGFGTEWADFDNDGLVELIISNGHVNEVKEDDQYGITFAMSAQMYRRDQSGSWNEMNANELGDYFSQRHVGRALATLDANRDGLVDVIITHLFEPVSLLINRTESPGVSGQLVFQATNGQRDAIGAIVTFELNGRQRTIQLLAGDGYMCSNQRFLNIGMGNAGVANNVTVRWPSGNQESFGTLEAGEILLLVEGSGEAFRLK